jgi:hypothetical protein
MIPDPMTAACLILLTMAPPHTRKLLLCRINHLAEPASLMGTIVKPIMNERSFIYMRATSLSRKIQHFGIFHDR